MAMEKEPTQALLSWAEFAKVDMRVGTIIQAKTFPEARRPAYQLQIDFGTGIGIRKSSAQITDLYTPDVLIGRQVIAVINFPPKQIGPFMSECLVLGLYGKGGDIILLQPERTVENGLKVG